jgi:hypothetical protein
VTAVQDSEADHASERPDRGQRRRKEPEGDLVPEDAGEDPEQKREVADSMRPAEYGRLALEPGREPEEDQGGEQP